MAFAKVIQVFSETDMRQSFDGLGRVAKKAKVDLETLDHGEYVVFFNRKRTYLKIAAANQVLACHRTEAGRFHDLTCILAVVRTFHEKGEVDYDGALKTRLTKLLT